MAQQLAAALCPLLAVAVFLPALAAAECECSGDAGGRDKARALQLKVVAIFCILAGGAAGAAVPSLGGRFPALRPDTDLFRAVKAFAGGVILATGLVHILPAAFDALGSPCLAGGGPWHEFPFAGAVAMLAAIATLVVDTVATGYFRRTVARKAAAVVVDEPPEVDDDHGRRAGDLEDAHHGHAHGMSVLQAPAPTAAGDDLVRHRVVSQVLELGVVVHSLIIGMSLGASDFQEHGAAARPGADVPPTLRGHRPRRVHCPGQVSAQVSGGDGALLLPDDPGRRRHRHRDILGVRRDESQGAGRAGAPRGRGGGDPGVHGARRHPRRGIYERQGAEQDAVAALAERLAAARGWHDVHARHLGLMLMEH